MKFRFIKKIFLFVLLCISVHAGIAQTNQNDHLSDQIYLYVDGGDLNNAYLRKHLPYAQFVREPQLSNVHVLITSVDNAAGGDQYRITFIGRKPFEGETIELKHVTQQYETEVEVREELLRVIQMGLMPFLAQTEKKNNIHFHYKQTDPDTSLNEMVDDPWNFWVFELGGDIWYEAEETQTEYMLGGSADFDRVTENWRFRNDIDYDIRFREFIDDDKVIQRTNEERGFNSSVVKSISSRWSGGLFVGWESSNFINLKSSGYVSPAIEYNIFPWEDLDYREFTIAYHVGMRQNDYFQETIYGRTEENLIFEELSVNFEIIKPWGEIETRLSGSHYFHDIKFNNVELDSEISFRLTKYLFFDIEAGFEMIHDQIYLQKGDASLEDILLEQRKLETNYEFEFEIGLDIRFGSIYNNVINNRL
jgi:hypothetical protein